MTKIKIFSQFVVLALVLSSCGSEIRSFKLTVYSDGPLQNIVVETPGQIKTILPKFEEGGTQYICIDGEFVRLDLDNTSGKIEAQHTVANEIKIKMGVELTAEDYLNDFQDTSHITYPTVIYTPKGESKNSFPPDCILTTSTDSIGLIIANLMDSSSGVPHIKIGIQQRTRDTSAPPPPPDTPKVGGGNNHSKGITEVKMKIFEKSTLGIDKSNNGNNLTWNHPLKSNTAIKYTLNFINNDTKVEFYQTSLTNQKSFSLSELSNIDFLRQHNFPKRGITVKITANLDGFEPLTNEKQLALMYDRFNKLAIWNCYTD